MQDSLSAPTDESISTSSTPITEVAPKESTNSATGTSAISTPATVAKPAAKPAAKTKPAEKPSAQATAATSN